MAGEVLHLNICSISNPTLHACKLIARQIPHDRAREQNGGLQDYTLNACLLTLKKFLQLW